MMAAKSLSSGYPLESLLAGIIDSAFVQDMEVTGIATDSRKVNPGNLFIACTIGGDSNIPYINDAIKAGAVAVLAEGPALPDPYLCSVPLFRAKDIYKRIGVIADRLYQHPSADMTIIGVTGTNGKTSVSHMLAQSLTVLPNNICGLIGTLGYGPINNFVPGPNTTPEPLALQALLACLREQKIHQTVMEVSSHGLDQYRIAGVKFELAIFTNLSRDHLDYHQTMQNYALAKRRFFTEYGIKKHVINIDDEFGSKLFNELSGGAQVIGCTLDIKKYTDARNRNTLVYAKIVDVQPVRMTMELKSPWGEGDISTQFIGNFNAHNILSVFSALCLLGYTFNESISRVSGCGNVPGRMECFGNNSTPRVIVDYAHTPDALEQVLSTLKSVCTGKLYCVFGCGGDRDSGKRPLMAAIAEKYANHITLTSDNPRHEEPEKIIQDILAGITHQQNVEVEIERETAIQNVIKVASVNDIVLIAGKGHENYQEIAGVRRPFSDQEIVKEVLETPA